ncbi:MAG: DNA alkylation repair protein [Spirochaetia bacterium]|nr:DNA alkylation repair protein [Spirochaetia bacterium]
MSNQLKQLLSDLHELASPQKAKNSARFFKTGSGEYGEGDQFLGLTVPEQRAIAKKFSALALTDIKTLVTSPWHEERLTGLIILVNQFKRCAEADKKTRYDFYLSHTKYINNWDLVDLTAHEIVGSFLEDKNRNILDSLAASRSLWERRIAMISTFHFIKQGDSGDALRIAEILLYDTHDLIQKATGWMLREIGKRIDQKILIYFLEKHPDMPRTTLRYAIEHFPETQRTLYLNMGKKSP